MLDDKDEFGTYNWITLGHSIAEKIVVARRVWGPPPNQNALKHLSKWLISWSKQVDKELEMLGLIP